MTSTKRGAAAGAVGAVVLSLEESVVRRHLGRLPVYAASRVFRRLSLEVVGVRLRDGLVPRVGGTLLRLAYGAALGAAYGTAKNIRPQTPAPVAAGVLATAIWSSEIVCMPLAGATPSVRSWPRPELALLALHTASFAVAAALTYERL